MHRRYRHIIWDWNGTLLDDLDLCIDIVNDILRPRGVPTVDRAKYHAVFDFPVRNYYAQLGLDTSDESFHALSVEFIAAYERRRLEAKLHRGAPEVLAGVGRTGRTQSILSAYRHETLCEIVEHFGLTSHFIRVAGLNNIYAQSKSELGLACMAELNLPAADVLMVGDTLHDFDVAAGMGIDCVLVAHGHHPFERLRTRCDLVYQDLTQLAEQLAL